ncbi:hypothetical protein QAD02_003194 [Eretmocerus hayati]|uniref:Uncharacterized protein n=1 Tax=Eretmocerus hayati TaxID=131215 RepID=A0ACC2NL04_9HYME|nr:hypothetical protein QAD02_003194 [Eretmocerus hayati]
MSFSRVKHSRLEYNAVGWYADWKFNDGAADPFSNQAESNNSNVNQQTAPTLYEDISECDSPLGAEPVPESFPNHSAANQESVSNLNEEYDELCYQVAEKSTQEWIPFTSVSLNPQTYELPPIDVSTNDLCYKRALIARKPSQYDDTLFNTFCSADHSCIKQAIPFLSNETIVSSQPAAGNFM